jgi:hypothetical protein
MGCGVPRSSHSSRTAQYMLIGIVTIVLRKIACATVCARTARFARVVQIIAVSTRALAVYIEIVFGRQQQLVKVAVASCFVACDRRVVVVVGIVVRIQPGEKAGKNIEVATAV